MGATFTVCIAGAIMLVGNDGIEHKILCPGPAQLVLALVSITGNFVRDRVTLSIVNAQTLGATEISLASAWASARFSLSIS